MKEQRKYKIDEAIRQLNLPNYKAALRIIPRELGIASNTFHNYRKLKITDKADIPYEMVRKLEIMFKMKIGELANSQPCCDDLTVLITEYHNLESVSA
ncbi:hypothetical protein CPT03_18790 [Pedobacter ginsengisoli]|uniref:Transcriptional regulator n=1 Tax=Pedobacter ginsengisoli TaxID=363852 RepID=A0A2D1U9U8_9SPHI|nr:hypothetical protein [Pedobacter ginsengisoli]ATP58362.1 hypothetical protein CPT03_18790 [Pedobacter ginsengisoli]